MATDLLAAEPDQFGGVIVDADLLPADADEFSALLDRSLTTWRTDGKRLVWLGVPLARAALIPVAVTAGFVFHHSNEGEVMMVCRLVEDAFVPTHATHYIGVGGVVINARQELLVVCERHRRTSQIYYKLPGGALQPGEHAPLVPSILLSRAGGQGSEEALAVHFPVMTSKEVRPAFVAGHRTATECSGSPRFIRSLLRLPSMALRRSATMGHASISMHPHSIPRSSRRFMVRPRAMSASTSASFFRASEAQRADGSAAGPIPRRSVRISARENPACCATSIAARAVKTSFP